MINTIRQLIIIKKTRKARKRKLAEGIKRFLKKKNKKTNNMAVKDIKTFLNMKNKCWLSIEKVVTKCGKTFRNNFQMYIKGRFMFFYQDFLF